MPRPSALLIALALPLLASFSDAFSLAPSLRPGRPNPAAGVHRARPAAARTVLCSAEAPALSNAPEEEAATPIYACPQCGTPCSLDQGSCGECGAPFTPRGGFVDMTPEATKVDAPKEESEVRRGQAGSILATAIASSGVQLPGRPLRQELFRTPMVSWMYERGWRNSFKQAGFPGIEREFELVQEFFEDKANKTVIDLSCGSGLMVRRLASSDRYGKVIAVDFSESMLGEVVKRAEEEKCPSFDVVRADVANMPFGDNTIDAIHSGAALHCWPYVQDGLKEVHRTLKPGGSFFATTFLWGIPDQVVSLGENLSSVSGRRAYRFFSPDELKWLMKGAGFGEVDVEQLDRCAIIRCKK